MILYALKGKLQAHTSEPELDEGKIP